MQTKKKHINCQFLLSQSIIIVTSIQYYLSIHIAISFHKKVIL